MQITLDIEPFTISLPEDGLDGNILEEIFYKIGLQFACMAFEELLKRLDTYLKKKRPKEYSIVATRAKSFNTRMGEVKMERTYYQSPEGIYHFLLDEYLGLEKHQRESLGFMREGLIQASGCSYRKSAEELKRQTSATVSHETVRNWVKMVGEKQEEVISEMVSGIFKRGVTLEAPSKIPERLFLEVDGTNIPVRKEGKVTKGELKLCLMYTGKEPRYSKGLQKSYKVKDKYVFGGLYSSDTLWDRLAVVGEMRFGISGIEDLKGIVKFFRNYLVDLSGQSRKRVEGLLGYILKNWRGILGWKVVKERLGEEAGLGAIEGNIDKVFASRFKDRGCCWSEAGSHALSQVRMLYLNQQLDEVLEWLKKEGRKIVVEPPEKRQSKRLRVKGEDEFYRIVTIPSLRMSLKKPYIKSL